MASPLTQFLNGINKHQVQSCNELSNDIWADVFDLEWKGDFDLLPRVNFELSTYKYIVTKRMYYRCKAYFERSKLQNYGTYLNSYCNDYHLCDDDDLDWHFDHYGYTATSDIVRINDLLIVAMENLWLDEMKDLLHYPVALATAAIYWNQVRFLQYLAIEHDVDLTRLECLSDGFTYTRALDIAAEYGYLDMLKYLHGAGNQACSVIAMDEAACNGNLDIVKWLHENRDEGCSSHILDEVIADGHMDVVEYLQIELNLRFTQDAIVRTAKRGDLRAVQFLHEQHHLNCSRDAIIAAIDFCHIKVVQYLFDNRFEELTSVDLDNAASCGDVSIVKYLFEKCNIECTTKAMDIAASQGYLDIVRYLHENGSKGCTSDAMNYATTNGHLDIVNFLQENGVGECK